MDHYDSDSDSDSILLSHTTWQDIVEGLENNTLIKVEYKDYAKGRPKNSPVLYLDAQTYPIDSKGAIAIAAALETNTSCQHCEFYSNLFGKEGAEAIASALLKNTTLKFLSLNTNNIGNEGIEAIANALLINKTLTSLDLSNNGREEDADRYVESIVNMMNVNTSLTKFRFGLNGLTEPAIISIIKVLSFRNHSLTSVDLNFNHIPHREDDEISENLKAAVSDLIQNNFSLTSFELFSRGYDRYLFRFSQAEKLQYDIDKLMNERNRKIQKEALVATTQYMRIWGSQMSNLIYDQFEDEAMRFYRNMILQIASKYMQ